MFTYIKILFLLLSSFFYFVVSGQEISRGATVLKGPVYDSLQKNVYAIIVGISKYSKLNNLHYADEDAILLKNFLISKPGGEVPLKNIKVYLDTAATGYAIETSAIQWLNTKKINKGDRIYFFFAGHGDEYRNDYFLLTADADTTSGPRNLPIQGNVKIEDLKYSFRYYIDSFNAEVFFIVDACRTNEKSNYGDVERAQKFSKIGSTQNDYYPSFYCLYASRDGFPAYESQNIGKGHGIFTYYLIEGLYGKADNAVSGNKDGNITLFELGSWLKTSISQKSYELFKREQMPEYCCSNDDRSIIFKIDPLFYKKYDSLNIVFEKVISDSTYTDFQSGLAKREMNKPVVDAELITTYNSFYAKLKGLNFTGNSSAESILGTLMRKWPGNELTEDARIALMYAFLIRAQTKINLYLSGLDVGYLKKFNEQYNLKDRNVFELQRVSLINFGDAATYMAKAMQLIKNDDKLKRRLESILWFLQARSYFDLPKNDITLNVAIKLANQALVRDTGAVHLYFLLGMLEQERSGNSSVAEQYFIKAITGESKWSKANLEIGYYYHKLGRFDKAESFYRRAINTNKDLARAYNNLAILFEDQQKFDAAESMYVKGLEKNYGDSIIKANFANFYNDRGLDYKIKREYKRATEYFIKAIKINADFVEPIINIGNSYTDREMYDSAEYYYEKALEMGDKKDIIAYNLGMSFYLSKQYEKARLAFEKCINLATPQTAIYKNSQLYLNESIRLLKVSTAKFRQGNSIKSIDLNISSLHTANEYYKLNKSPEARKYYMIALKEDSTNCEILFPLAKLEMAGGNMWASAGLLSKCIEQGSADVEVYLLLGKCFSIQKDYDDAEKVYLKYYNANPKEKKILIQLLKLYNITGREKDVKRLNKELDKLYK